MLSQRPLPRLDLLAANSSPALRIAFVFSLPLILSGAVASGAAPERLMTSVFAATDPPTHAAAACGDSDRDGDVDLDDLLEVLANFGVSGGRPAGDVNQDGVVDFDDMLYVLGGFGQNGIAPWYTEFAAPGPDADVRALAFDPDQQLLYAGGWFTAVAGDPASFLATWNGGAWDAVPVTFGNVQCCNTPVTCLAIFDDGRGPALYVGGEFEQVDGEPMAHIARWDGVQWEPLGPGINDEPLVMRVFDDGRGPALYVGGFFSHAGATVVNHIARWDGAQWEALDGGVGHPGSPFIPHVDALAEWNGQLIAGGDLTLAGSTPVSYLAAWDGGNWAALPGAFGDFKCCSSPITALAVHDDGSGQALYVGGEFATIDGNPLQHLARLDGAVWSAVGGVMDEEPLALLVHDDIGGPSLFATGFFTEIDGKSLTHIARWDGTRWTAMGLGLGSPGVALEAANGLGGISRRLFAAGLFTTVDGEPADRIAEWRPDPNGCP